jgi:hypothetical protein
VDTRERRREDETRNTRHRSQPGQGNDELEGLRSNAERLLSAADQAIERALSDNSEDFLRATRQRGGE